MQSLYSFVTKAPPPTPAWVRFTSTAIRLLPRGRYPLMNALCRNPIASFVRELGVTDGRVNFLCDPRDGIAREVCFMGHYEPQETVLMLHLLRPGMTFVDVGANWGYFTLLAADIVGPSGRVIAFEPHPELFDQLQGNVQRNDLTWVTPVEVAVADVDGEMILAGFDERQSNWGVSRLVTRSGTTSTEFRVETRLLESMLDHHGVFEVDLLKMDIEGAESLVLPTMSKGLLNARYKCILLELHPEALKEGGLLPWDLIHKLLGFGYRGWMIDHSNSAFRRAAYHLPASPSEFLAPVDDNTPLGNWPHILFLAPGVIPTW
jgi:FkbM family methyltransferase